MASNGFAKHYDQLNPPERFVLAIEAMARNDDVELTRLRTSCPRYSYLTSDSAYTDRMEASFLVTLAAFAEMHEIAVNLRLLEDLSRVMLAYMEGAIWLCQIAFDEGHRCGWRLARHGCDSATPGDARDPDGAPDTSGRGSVDDPDTETAFLRVAQVGGRIAAPLLNMLEQLPRHLAMELATRWAGFGMFCRVELNLDSMALLQAWQCSTERLDEALARHPDLEPPKERVAAYAALLLDVWKSQVPAS